MPGETSISPNKKVVNPPRFFANSSFQTVDFIEHISFKTFNEGTHLVSSVQLVQELFHTKLKLLGADGIYATNANRKYCRQNNILTGFVRKGHAGKHESNLKQIRRSINIKRTTEREGSFRKQKKHYNLECINACTEITELLWIFFGIHTANAVEIGRRIKQRQNQFKISV